MWTTVSSDGEQFLPRVARNNFAVSSWVPLGRLRSDEDVWPDHWKRWLLFKYSSVFPNVLRSCAISPWSRHILSFSWHHPSEWAATFELCTRSRINTLCQDERSRFPPRFAPWIGRWSSLHGSRLITSLSYSHVNSTNLSTRPRLSRNGSFARECFGCWLVGCFWLGSLRRSSCRNRLSISIQGRIPSR